MAYNITNWTTKKINHLQIPMMSFTKHPRRDWHPRIYFQDDETLVLERMDSMISGMLIPGAGIGSSAILDEDILVVSEISIEGEGSGTFMETILQPALAESKGELIAIRIWEGGDSIDRIIVRDGDVTIEDVT